MTSFENYLFQFIKYSRKIDCSSVKMAVSNTNEMPKSTGMNGHTDSTAAAPTSKTPDFLRPTTNSSVNLSSNSSLNSSSVKSMASKSNDGTAIEKKRKSLSSSRQKKFHRHFKQVATDEEVINCTYKNFEWVYFLLSKISFTNLID